MHSIRRSEDEPVHIFADSRCYSQLTHDDCYRVEGFSAQDIYRKTYLTEIGAYNYLIYLRKYPKQALKDLKDGLPRK